MDIPILDPEKKPSDANLEAFLSHPSLLEALNAFFSGPQPRIVLGREGIEEIVEIEASSARIRAGEAGLEPEEEEKDDDEIEMVTEVVEEEPGRVDFEDSSGSKGESLDVPLADSSDKALRSSGDSITRNADFVAFGS